MILLSVIIPIACKPGSVQRIDKWMNEIKTFDIEIIVVEDKKYAIKNGELSISRIIERMKEKAVVNYICKPFEGPADGRNIGKEFANGEWIAFWDSDDIPNVEASLEIIRENRNSEIDIIIGQYSEVSVSKNTTTQKSMDRNLYDLALNPGLWRMFFKNTKKFKELKFYSTKMGEDQTFIIDAFVKLNKIKFSCQPVYNYYVDQNFQLTKDKTAIEDLINTLRYVIYETQPESFSLKQFKSNVILRMLITLIKDSISKHNYKTISFCIGNLRKVNIRSYFWYITRLYRAR